MAKAFTGLPEKILAFIYFAGFEVFVYYGLSYLLFDQVAQNPDERKAIIVQNWNNLVYFILLYAALTTSSMLLLTSALPRHHKPQVMLFYWLSWPGLVIMLFLAFN